MGRSGEWEERRGGGGVGIRRKGKDADGVDSTVCCGLWGEKRREAGEALRLQLKLLLLLRLPSKVPKCAKKIQVFESRRKKHTKKTKTPPAGGRNTPRLSHLCCLKERQRKNYGDTRWSLSVIGGSFRNPPTGNQGQIEMFTLELEIYLFFVLFFF